MTIVLRLATALILCAPLPVLAQNSGDVAIERLSVQGAVETINAPFPPGAALTLTAIMHNAGDRAMRLRGLDLALPPEVAVVDPQADGVDNDDDGDVDDADEGRLVAGKGERRLEPGTRVTHRLRLTLAEDALPGGTATLSLTASAVPIAARNPRPVQAKDTAALPIAPAILTLTSEEDASFETGKTALLSGTVTLPGGVLPDGRVSITLPPAMAKPRIQRYRIGAGLRCEGGAEPVIRGDEAMLELGRCRADPETPADERIISLTIASPLVDAPPGANDAALSDWRSLSIYMGLWSGEDLLAGKVMNRTMTGPRLLTTASVPRRGLYRLGDPVPLTVTIANRGDQSLRNPRLILTNPESFTCDSAREGTDGDDIPCRDNTLPLSDFEEGEERAIAITLRLRRDAPMGAETGPAFELAAEGIGNRALPIPPVTMALHDPPSLSIVDHGAWRKMERVVAATIGDTGRLRMTGTLPPGRYRGAVTLLARTVDARTGAPVAPAALSVAATPLSINTLDGQQTGETGTVTQDPGALWSQYAIPFDLTNATDQADQNRRFTVDLDVTLKDDPALVVGTLLELVAETTAYDNRSVAGDSWVDILVQEPELRLKTFSLDADRTIHLGEPFGALSLACNYGDSPAFGTIMTLDTPPAVDLAATQARIRPLIIPLSAVRTGTPETMGEKVRPVREDALSIDGLSITLDHSDTALAPEDCIGIELRAPLQTDRRETLSPSAAALTVLRSYTGNREADTARRYPGARTAPLRFKLPVIDLGPSATLPIGAERQIRHAVKLSVPETLGPYRVAVSSQSSARLNWEILEERDDTLTPWQDNARTYPAGTTLALIMRSTAPDILPLGWVDTSRLKAEVLTDDGARLNATLRLVNRSETERPINTDKRVALDRDCDGDLTDESVQDALFEPVKDAIPGECIVVRIGFENAGTREVARIIIRDALSKRTTLLPDSATVRIAPEPLDTVSDPAPESGVLQWEFEGLFRPGAVGEVEYRLRLDPQ